MDPLSPSTIRYIKLGKGGCWEAAALDGGRLEWGLPSDPHDAALASEWDTIIEAYRVTNPARGTATGYTNESRAFYDHDPEVLWITFARGRMWWTFAEPVVHWRGGDGASEGTRYRTALGGWSDKDCAGDRLDFDRLSTRVTRLSGYRRTICGLTADQQELCLRYINAERDPAQQAVAIARDELRDALTVLIQRLSWADFEQLIDLAMARSGWLRVSDLGGTAKDIDLIVQQPLTGERIEIQVKSSATQAVVDDYAARLRQRSACERRMLICHSPAGKLVAPPAAPGCGLELMLGGAVSDLSVKAGLVDWIVERAR